MAEGVSKETFGDIFKKGLSSVVEIATAKQLRKLDFEFPKPFRPTGERAKQGGRVDASSPTIQAGKSVASGGFALNQQTIILGFVALLGVAVVVKLAR